MVGDPSGCENCDRPDDDLVAVYRVYLDPDDPDNVVILTTAERWCFSCRSMYPHQLAD